MSPSLTSLKGLNVCVTGKIAGESRTTANAKLAAAGAHVQDNVTKATHVLIMGADDGQRGKLDKAELYEVPVILWGDAVDLMANGHSVATSAPPIPASTSTRNQPVRAQAGYRQIRPMLCLKTEPDEIPTGEGWLFEFKWNGYRCVATVDGNGGAILASRKGKDYERFVKIREELEAIPIACVLDGEIVSLDPAGHSQFADLHAGDQSKAKLILFDLLELDGVDLRGEPLSNRKKLLGDLITGGVYLGYMKPFDDGQALWEYAVEHNLEGIVAKQKSSTYRENGRGAEWRKIKNRDGQEFVLVGYTKGKGSRAGTAGALLLAVNDGTARKPEWTFCGTAGSGGTVNDFKAIVAATTKTPEPCLKHDLTRAELKEVTWVKPEVVVNVEFETFTKDGKLTHPSIQGMRTDKKPHQVRREP